jgi:class 3 adenylate cyclase/tetratricopeptide (TPR) repeat protein
MQMASSSSSAPDIGARLRPYLPRITLRWLHSEPERIHREDEASMVFVDISGFTKLSEKLAKVGKLGAEEIANSIDSCFAELLDVAYRDDGTLLKFGGDALLLAFTSDDPQEHAERACRAAWGMRRRLREIGRLDTAGGRVTLRMSVGVHTGSYHMFLVGRSHRELLITGPAVTRLTEMEAAAGTGEILVSPETAAVVSSASLGAEKPPGVLLRAASGEPLDRVSLLPPVAVGLESCIPLATREYLQFGAPEPEHRQVSVAFLHFDGTDEMFTHEGPDRAASELDRLVCDVQEAADEHGVCFLASDIDRDGGKIILTAGAPRATGADEERLLLATRRIVEGERAIPVRIGVNRGHVFAGDVGPAYRRTYTVMGDAVNLAARVMGKAEPGQVLATADVLDRSETLFDLTALEPFSVKGKSEPARAWVVGEPVGTRSRRRRRQDGDDLGRVPLVGREDEMGVLRAAMGSAVAGTGRAIEVIGEVGVGKTRLLEEIRAESADLPTLRATCEAYASSTPYVAWRELMRDLLDIGWEDPPEVAIERLWAAVAESDPELMPWLPLIALTFDVTLPPTLEIELLGDEFRRSKLHESVLRFLEVRLPGPALIEIEDVQHMDEASAALLAHVLGEIDRHPWLLIVSRRDEGEGFRAAPGPALTSMQVEPLGPLDTRALAEAVTEQHPMPPHVVGAIADRSGGNPQFLIDLVRAVVETGSADELPDSVEAATVARIDRLDPADRTVLRLASVLGVSFHPRMLEWLSDGDAPVEPGALERLQGFFEDEGGGFLRFRNAIVREAAYDGLPFKTRKRLHVIAGLRFEEELQESDEVAGVLARHFFLGGDHARAWRYSRIAADRARDMYAYGEAAQLYRRALSAAGGAQIDPRELADVWEAFGLAKEAVGEPREATAAYTAARALVRGDPIREAELLYRHSVVDGRSGRIVPAVRWARRGLRTLEGNLDPRAVACRAKLYSMLAGIRVRQGHDREAIELAQQAIRAAEIAREQESLANACLVIAWARSSMGAADEETYSQRALGIYEGLGNLLGQSMALNNIGMGAYWQERWDDAVDSWTRAAETSDRAGDAVGAAFADCNIAEVLSDQGRFDEAEARFRRALQVWRGTDDEHGVAYASAQLGRTYIRAGRIDEGLALLRDALERHRALRVQGDALDAEVWITEGEVARGDPGVDATIARLARKVEDGSPAQRSLDRLGAYVLAQRGETAAARERLTEAAERAREAGSSYDLAIALDAIARLEDDPAVRRSVTAERGAILKALGVERLPEPPLRAGSGVPART